MDKRATIFVLDDDPVILDAVKHMLENDGYSVFTAQNIEEAKGFIRIFQPDIILSDILLPKSNGIEFFDHVKRAYAGIGKNPAFLFMSSAADEEDVEMGLGVGAVAYITKPFHYSKLSTALKSVLSLGQNQSELEENKP